MIGVIDSGVGGLSVLRELVRAMPGETFAYRAVGFPLGTKSEDELQDIARVAACELDDQCREIVLACNTLSIAAAEHLRQRRFNVRDVASVGARVAGEAGGYTLVLASAFTACSGYFQERIGNSAVVPVPSLIDAIEHGDGLARVRLLLQDLAEDFPGSWDNLLLACTHLPLVRGEIERAFPRVNIIDPARHLCSR